MYNLRSLIKYKPNKNEQKPVFLSELLSVASSYSLSDFESIIEEFQYYVNLGGYVHTKSSIKPKFLEWICSFEDAMNKCEESNIQDFDKAVDILKSEIDSGVTIGDLWINHNELGNQIMQAIDSLVNRGAKSFYISECYNEVDVNDKATDFKRKKCTLVTDSTYIFLENNTININMSMKNCDIYDVVKSINLRHLLCRLILSSQRMRGVILGDINILLNNFIYTEEQVTLHNFYLKLPEIDYASEYYNNGFISMYEDYKKNQSKKEV